jgi:hypothetical protein
VVVPLAWTTLADGTLSDEAAVAFTRNLPAAGPSPQHRKGVTHPTSR